MTAGVAPPVDRLQALESWVRAEYERRHPGETFEDLKRRAQFSKEDKGLLRDWLEAAKRHVPCTVAPPRSDRPSERAKDG
jgi:hypothetical protein